MLIFPGILSMCFSMPFLTTPSTPMTTGIMNKGIMTTGDIIFITGHIIIIIIIIIINIVICFITGSFLTQTKFVILQRERFLSKAQMEDHIVVSAKFFKMHLNIIVD